MGRINRNLITALMALVILFVGCSKKEKHQPPPPRVTSAAIVQQDVPIYVNTIGQVIPTVTVNIRPQVYGKLLEVYFQQGAIVNAGDILYEVDPRPYLAILDETIAQLKHDEALLLYAQQAVKRYKEVVEEDFLSVLNYEQLLSNESAALAQVELDKASIRAAQINVDYCKIVAPVSGKVSYYNVDVGNIVSVDDPNQLTVIRPFSPIDIEFSLPQQQFEMIRHVQGNSGEWRFVAVLPENPTHAIEGISYFVDNQLDQGTGTILLKGRVPNDLRALWPGEFVRVNVLYRIAPGALVVPPSSVLIGKDGPYVYIIDADHKAQAINAEVLTRTEQYIAIQSDKLKAGDIVIVDGQINVAPGLTVQVSNKQ